ncbi:adenylate cyclase type 8-like [Rhincodon typus]|uniref:adenylate cyclase type 8-like n=1 Tax=Rhincodon typus TaxID=259920 RepID=UPI00202FC554|nr:adenylate cyclase type 8-like [Rhincodon typus]
METLVESAELQTTTVTMSHHSPTQSRQWQNIVNVFSKRHERLTDSDGVPKRRFIIKNEYIEDINQQIQSKLTGRAKSSIFPTVFATAPVSERMSDIFVSPGFSCLGILLPTINQTFKSKDLEKLYQRYFARQRRISLMMMNIIDCFTKFNIMMLFFVVAPELIEPLLTGVTGLFILFSSMLCFLVQAGKDAISHNYLQYLGLATWFYQSVQILLSWGMGLETNETWFILFIVFGTYTMLPIPLLWGILAGSISSVVHLLIEGFRYSRGHILLHQVYVKMLLLLCMNVASLFISYLSVRAQRMAFLETRKNIEGRLLLEDENERQERLVLSVLPRFMVLEIINDMSDAAEKQGAFHKIYVHQYQNVRRIHISEATLKCLKGDYETEAAYGQKRSDLLEQYKIKTYFIKHDDFAGEAPRIRVSIAKSDAGAPKLQSERRKTETVFSSSFHIDASLLRVLEADTPWRLDHPFNRIVGLNKIFAALTKKKSQRSDTNLSTGVPSSRFDEINRRVEHAIEVRSSDKLRAAYLNEITLSFKDSGVEKKHYRKEFSAADHTDTYLPVCIGPWHHTVPATHHARRILCQDPTPTPGGHHTNTGRSPCRHREITVLTPGGHHTNTGRSPHQHREITTPTLGDHRADTGRSLCRHQEVTTPTLRGHHTDSRWLPCQHQEVTTPTPGGHHTNTGRVPHQHWEVTTMTPGGYHNNIGRSLRRHREVATPTPRGHHTNTRRSPRQHREATTPTPGGHHTNTRRSLRQHREATKPTPRGHYTNTERSPHQHQEVITPTPGGHHANTGRSLHRHREATTPTPRGHYTNTGRELSLETENCCRRQGIIARGWESSLKVGNRRWRPGIVAGGGESSLEAGNRCWRPGIVNGGGELSLEAGNHRWKLGIVAGSRESSLEAGNRCWRLGIAVGDRESSLEAGNCRWRPRIVTGGWESSLEAGYRKVRDEVFTSNVVCCFIVLLFTITVQSLFEVPDSYSDWQRGIIFMLTFMFLVTVFYQGRQIEATARLDFLWRLLARQEMDEMAVMRKHNEDLLNNMLPSHIARHFLDKDPDDELLGDERFLNIEKIKTIGSTYMAVSGLASEQQETLEDSTHLCSLADFALALENTMEEIHKHSHINFKLRVGFAHGAAVSGVIGVKKPQFDIWGSTVNFASRMDSTGISGKIQVPKETSRVLETRGFSLQYRGQVFIKGVSETFGEVETYFLERRVTQAATPKWMRRQSAQHSFSVILSGLSQKSSPAWYPL